MTTRSRRLACAALAVALSASAHAADLFEITVASPGGPTLQAGGSNVLDLVEDLLDTTGSFQTLSGSAFTGDLRFLGIRDALSFTQNPDGSGIVNFNLIGENYAYADQDDLEDYLKSNGNGLYARFLKEAAKRSPASVTDGNPAASTASSARADFMAFGRTDASELVFDTPTTGGDEDPAGLGGFGLGINSGTFEVDVDGQTFEGRFADVGLTWLNLGGESIRLAAPLSVSYLDLEGTETYGVNQSIALPIRLKRMSKTERWNWRITPMAGASLRASLDAASGAVLWNAGLIHTLDYRVNSRLIVSLVNQASAYQSVPVAYSDYEFDPDIEQTIVKNGVRLVTPLTRRLFLDGYVIHTQFLEDAAVESFMTYGASLALKASKGYSLTLGANYDSGDNFESYSVGLSSAWHW